MENGFPENEMAIFLQCGIEEKTFPAKAYLKCHLCNRVKNIVCFMKDGSTVQ